MRALCLCLLIMVCSPVIKADCDLQVKSVRKNLAPSTTYFGVIKQNPNPIYLSLIPLNEEVREVFESALLSQDKLCIMGTLHAASGTAFFAYRAYSQK